jgi:hypothetical protein
MIKGLHTDYTHDPFASKRKLANITRECHLEEVKVEEALWDAQSAYDDDLSETSNDPTFNLPYLEKQRKSSTLASWLPQGIVGASANNENESHPMHAHEEESQNSEKTDHAETSGLDVVVKKKHSKYWDILRAIVVPEKKFDVFTIFGGKAAPIPYVISISVGIFPKFQVHSGSQRSHTFAFGRIHERLLLGGTLHNVAHKRGSGNKDGASDEETDEESITSSRDSLDDLVDEAIQSISETKPDPSKSKSGTTNNTNTNATNAVVRKYYSATVIDRHNHLVIYDVTKGVSPFRVLSNSVIPVEISGFVAIVELGLYATYSEDETFKLFGPRFEHCCTVLAWSPVLWCRFYLVYSHSRFIVAIII